VAPPKGLTMPLSTLDLIFGFVGFGLTLSIWTYLVGDNPLYRIALHLVIGAVAGYVAVVVTFNVLVPQLSLSAGVDWVAWGGAWLLALLMIGRFFGSNLLTRLPVAYLVGVGAAVAAGGALTGTLFPQVAASFEPAAATPDVLEDYGSLAIIILGVICTLAFFQYGGRTLPGGRPDHFWWVKPLAWPGQIFIGAALGVMFAGALAASLALFAERVSAIWILLKPYLGA
jgi:hypothetical protein